MALLHLPIEPPPTHQAALRILKTRDGRQFIGKMAKSSAKKWSNTAVLLMKSEFNKQRWKPLDAPCQVGIILVYPHTKESKRLQEKTGKQLIIKSTRPDVDNVVKSILDCLVDSQWLTDDGLIVELIIKKFHGTTPSVIVDIDVYNDE
ncbi:Rus Holliday junction resolvase [uncultured Caudovirales phage]|uniref:Rus Holliday junction resolvase n=1 Tax=uncultured Caudovirales phage TaxID=2100421 RepID=A0A6J7XNC4_9CAUD|nr:Rus Holliday junction resolvase [uncultured Caudovirales phage]